MKTGIWAPLRPKDARSKTGKGSPYFAPAMLFAHIARMSTTFATVTVPIACQGLMPK